MHFDEQFYRFLELYQNGKEMPMIFLRSEEPMVSRVRTNGYRETAFGLDSLLLSENMSCSDVDSRARSTENDREWSKLNRIADEIYTIERLNDTNLFFAVNEFRYNPFLTRKSSTEKGGIRRKKQCLKAFHFLYVDVDFKDCEELRGTYPTEEDIQKVKNKYLPEIMNMLGTALPPATMIVMSGHGIHIYWKIKKLLHNSRLGTGNSLFWYVAQDYFYQSLRKYGADARVAHDFCRIMRIPGSYNKKDGMAPVKAKIIHFAKTEEIDIFRMLSEYKVTIPESTVEHFEKQTGVKKCTEKKVWQ